MKTRFSERMEGELMTYLMVGGGPLLEYGKVARIIVGVRGPGRVRYSPFHAPHRLPPLPEKKLSSLVDRWV